MAQARKRIKSKPEPQPLLTSLDQRLHEASAIFLFVLTGYITLCLITYNVSDPGFIHLSDNNLIANSGGRLGAWLSDIMFYFFGYISFWLPLCLGYASFKSYSSRKELIWPPCWLTVFIKSFGFIFTLLAGSALSTIYINQMGHLLMGPGGLVGRIISNWSVGMFNVAGASVLLLGLLSIGITLVTGFSWLAIMDFIGKKILQILNTLIYYLNYIKVKVTNKISDIFKELYYNYKDKKAIRSSSTSTDLVVQNEAKSKNPNYINIKASSNAAPHSESKFSLGLSKLFGTRDNNIDSSNVKKAKIKTQTNNINNFENLGSLDSIEAIEPIEPIDSLAACVGERSSKLNKLQIKVNQTKINELRAKPKNLSKAKQLKMAAVTPDGLPDVSLLETPEYNHSMGYSEDDLHGLSRLVEQRLLDFGVQAEVVGVQPGPVIVRFELQLAAGIKVSKVSSLAKDLARSLSIVSVRVVEVIPGKPYVGLEIPNTNREIVRLRELLEHQDYLKAKSPLTLVLGKGISGKTQLADLAKMPHLLVAGTTGSGKSVGVNAMLLSILFKASPKDVRLIMIDPKMLELSVYDGIPHLLCPVVTDMKDAANALKWCVAEMERRYKLMATLGVRNLAGCNRKIEDARASGDPILDPLWPENNLEEPPELETLPFIVVVVDEFADMIMVVGRKVEELIARIAQKARAAGIHMILATQRPSVDVITGLIKANVPTRIAFQVSSKIDSRTILDQQGAEQLLGQGDMLYLPPGSGLPVRVHGAFVSDQEVHSVADDWRARQAPDYNEDIVGSNINIPGLPKLATDDFEDDAENDPLYDQAVQFILETRRASISSVQRRFKIGYNRAARIIEQMEAAGIVGPMGSKGGREILIPEGQSV